MNAHDYPRSEYEVYFEKIVAGDRWLARLYSYDREIVVEEQTGVGGSNAADDYIRSRMPIYARKEIS